MKRLVLFSFYDHEDIVDDYVLYLLASFKGIAEEICTIVNGHLTSSSQKKLENFSKILMRENKGFDAWGYKHGLEKYGYEELKRYDEIVCLNHTCFGPVFPWKEMFERMSQVDCDWWSLFQDHCPQNLLPGEHMPSYFIVYRKSLVMTQYFKEFWDTMPEIKNYEDDVRFYENRQTPFFDKYGFKRAVAFDFSRFDNRTDNWPLNCTKEMLIDDHVPLLKRRPLFIQKGNIDAELFVDVFKFISEHTNYDINLIIQNLKRTQDFDSIKHPSFLKKIAWQINSRFSFTPEKRVKYESKLRNLHFLNSVQEIIKETDHE